MKRMKILLDLQENRVPLFMELLKSLGYVRILKEVKDEEKNRAIEDLIESFEDIKLHEQGKKKLKSAKDVLDELWCCCYHSVWTASEKIAKKHKSIKQDILPIIEELQLNPDIGTPLGKGCFKIRFAISSKNKGKSGGGRIITFFRSRRNTVYLIDIFDKSDKASISEKELQLLIELLIDE